MASNDRLQDCPRNTVAVDGRDCPKSLHIPQKRWSIGSDIGDDVEEAVFLACGHTDLGHNLDDIVLVHIAAAHTAFVVVAAVVDAFAAVAFAVVATSFVAASVAVAAVAADGFLVKAGNTGHAGSNTC